MSGLDIQDPKTMLCILDGLDNLLYTNHECNKLTEVMNFGENRIFQELQKYQIEKVLEDLQKLDQKEIYHNVFQIVERHFMHEDMLG